ncbi:MAG TPA: hypothetical protein DEH22_05970 [Chloroflexi bacterium]|nr:hypothetical protein [Chloroflexota bacterium]
MGFSPIYDAPGHKVRLLLARKAQFMTVKGIVEMIYREARRVHRDFKFMLRILSELCGEIDLQRMFG